jgi:regulatory protein
MNPSVNFNGNAIMSELNKAYQSALNYLSRREYSAHELRQRLLQKNFEETIINAALIQLEKDNYLSQARFIESLVYSKIQRGYGPLRIQQELRQHTIDSEALLHSERWQNADWFELARDAREKRFGLTRISDLKLKAKQFRFLYARGFSQDQIKYALSVQMD